jgi:hypothetical protein
MLRIVHVENTTMTVQISCSKEWDKRISLKIFDIISLLLMDDNIKIDTENKQDKRLWTGFI